MVFFDLGTSFILGLLTPLTAVCVLPLYPGFLSYLSSKIKTEHTDNNRKTPLIFGLLVVVGVILFMAIIGFVFTTVLQMSLTNVIGIVSPIAFSILAVISIILMLDIDISKYLPRFQAPVKQNPYHSAFLFGLFFGAVVIPCNPLFIAALFTKAVTITGFAVNMLNFIMFGIGIGFPLLVFSILSSSESGYIIKKLTLHKSKMNRVSGGIMFVVSLYYLIFVFQIFG